MSSAKAGKPAKLRTLKAGRPSRRTNVTAELLERMSDKPKMVRVTFEIPADAHTRLKMLAVLKRSTMADVLRGLILKLPDAGGTDSEPEFQGRMKIKPDAARMTIDLPEESRVKLKLFAARRRTTMTDVLRWLISNKAGEDEI